MVARASCVLDKKYCKAYADAVFPARKAVLIADITASIIILAVCAVLIVIKAGKALPIILLLAVLLSCNAVTGLIFASAHLLYYKALDAQADAKCDYTFDDEGFTLKITAKNNITKEEYVKYCDLKKAQIRGARLVIHQDGFIAHIIDQKSSTINLNELFELINSQIKK